ncbi:Ff.00g020260.m01.CDS01 [Fusarium sp. VM40]|nr:Ff.00g020260.m01.CDS01 [Fusarium sp. VM40]
MSSRSAVFTPNAPKVGPFMSQAVISNGLVFSAGSLGLDPATGQFVEGTVADRAAQALRNLDAVFVAAGTSLSKAVKVTIFLSSMDHLPLVNEAYAKFFTEDPKPARTCVAGAVLPLDAELEIEAVASLD